MRGWPGPFELLARVARRPPGWLGVPVALYAWTLPAPLLFDDLHLVLTCERYAAGQREELALFEFAGDEASRQALIDRGTIPWWTPAGTRVAFFRPLAEWSFYADVRLFGRGALGPRCVSLAWFVIGLALLHRLYGAVSGDAIRAGVATLLVGVSQATAAPVAFVSNRSDLLVLTGVTAAGLAYWSAGRWRFWRAAVVAMAGFAMALLSKETAVALAGVTALHALGSRGGAGPGERSARRGVAVLLAAMAAAYLVHYAWSCPARVEVVSSGWGVLGIVASVPRTLGLYLAVWTLGIPINALWQWATEGQVAAVALAGGAGAVIAVWSMRRGVSRAVGARFFGLWSVLFLAPALLTVAEQRAIFLATVGWAYLLAGMFVSPAGAARGAPSWVRHWLLTTNGTVSVACVAAMVGLSVHAERESRRTMEQRIGALNPPLRDGDALIVGEAALSFEIPFAGDRLEYLTGRRDVSVAFLTATGAGAEVARDDGHTLRLSTASGDLFGSPLHRLALGPDWTPTVGTVFRTREFVAELTGAAGWRVTEMRVRFGDPLDSARLHFAPESLAAAARGH